MPNQIPEQKPEFTPPKPEIEVMPEEIEAKPAIEAVPEAEKEVLPAPAEIPPPAAPSVPPAPAVKKDPTTMAVEKILEEDLGDLYVKLDPQSREKVRAEGDVLVNKLRIMVDSLRVQARKVLHLIRDWLKMIPGINKYFLEQEAKIKTDQIIDLAEKEKQKRQGLV